MPGLDHRRQTLLVDAPWLENLLAAGPMPNDKTCVILEVNFPEHDAFEAHGEPVVASPRARRCIPGAISVHPSYFEAGFDESKYYPRYGCPEDGNLLPDDRLHAAIARLGITEDTMVVVYGKGAVAPMAACRALWALMYAGVKDARMLDGGFAEWGRHGGELAASPAMPVPATRFNESGAVRRELLASSDEVGSVSRAEARGVVVDVRKLGEYEGWDRDNYGFFSTAGHIPGCVYQGNWDELVDMKTGRLRSVADVEQRWALLGLSKARGPMMFYCGTGWRSSIAFVLAYMLGWESKNYDDGWFGWSVGLDESDCRVCRKGCGCNIIKDEQGFTVRALQASPPPLLCEEVDVAYEAMETSNQGS